MAWRDPCWPPLETFQFPTSKASSETLTQDTGRAPTHMMLQGMVPGKCLGNYKTLALLPVCYPDQRLSDTDRHTDILIHRHTFTHGKGGSSFLPHFSSPTPLTSAICSVARTKWAQCPVGWGAGQGAEFTAGPPGATAPTAALSMGDRLPTAPLGLAHC